MSGHGRMAGALRSWLAVSTGQTARKSLLSVAAQGLISATNFAIGVLLARTGGKEDFGFYVLGVSVLLFVQGLQDALIISPVTVLGARRSDAAWRAYAAAMFRVQFTQSLIVAGLVVGVGLALGASGCLTGEGRNMFHAVGLTAFFLQGRGFARGMMYARLRPVGVLVNDVLYCALLAGAMLTLWLGWGGKWGGTEPSPGALTVCRSFLCMSGSAAISCAFAMWQLRGDIDSRAMPMRDLLRETWAFARWTLAGFAASALLAQVNVWVIGAVGGITQVAVVEAARLLMSPIQVVSQGAPNVLLPGASKRFVESGLDGLRIFMRRMGVFWLGSHLGYGLLIAVAPMFWLTLLYGDRYQGSAAVLITWIGVYVLAGINRLFGITFRVLKRPDLLVKVMLPVSAGTICLTALLSQSGPEAAVGARLIGAGVNFVGLSWLMLRLMRKGPTSGLSGPTAVEDNLYGGHVISS